MMLQNQFEPGMHDSPDQTISEQKRIELLLRQTAERERAIAHIIQSMRQTLDLESIFSATTQELRQAIQCDRVVIYQFNPDWSGEFVAESVAPGWVALLQKQDAGLIATHEAINGDRCTLRESALNPTLGLNSDTHLQSTKGGAYSQGTPHLCVSDIYAEGFSSCYIECLEQFQTRAYMTVPIFCGSKLWGLLASYQNKAPRHWETPEIKLVTQIAAQLGVAIQQAELLAQTQQQAAELKLAKELADSASRAKSEFLANMSHELRTPLNAILGFTQLMHRDSTLHPEHQQYIEIISRSGEHLMDLINSVLEMAKIETGRIRLNETSFNLSELLYGLEQLFCLKASTKGLTLTVEQAGNVPQFITADEGKLRQVLTNLLSNSIKFTEKGSVSLHVSAFAQGLPGKTCLRFDIQDTGAGIAPNELDKLFEPFEQTSTGISSSEGSGLGLPISQKLVNLMGGKITVNSRCGLGTLFRFEISARLINHPMIQAPQRPLARAIGLALNQPSYRLLVVEDSSTNRLVLVKLLSRLGFEVMEAENGQVGLDVWEYWEPHLIWMDMQMPVMDGYEATKRIKATSKGQETVIIALTASVFEEQRQAILTSGCDDFVRKPFQSDELLAKLSQHLGVQYVYQEQDTPCGSSAADGKIPLQRQVGAETTFSLTHALRQMPVAWVAELEIAAAQCDDCQLQRLVRQIPEIQSELAHRLKQMTHNFQFDQILGLVHTIAGAR